jgi:hypothetical protein
VGNINRPMHGEREVSAAGYSRCHQNDGAVALLTPVAIPVGIDDGGLC